MKRSLACVASAVGLTLCLALPAVAGPSREPAAEQPVPVLAYYYIWFNPRPGAGRSRTTRYSAATPATTRR